MDFRDKIIPRQGLAEWSQSIKAAGKKLVVTNGCFDLLHVGHVTYLQQARSFGDLLLVGLNDDASVRQLKGGDRPLNGQKDRASVLAALQSVDAVCIFSEPTAVDFLRAAQPDIYVKGGDYTLETLNQAERQMVEEGGGRIVIIPAVPGKSTTALVERIAQL